MKTTVVTPYSVKTKTAWEMSIGDIGFTRGSAYVGHVVLRTFNGVVSLTNPRYTWSFDTEDEAKNIFSIEPLPVGSTVTLLVEAPDVASDEEEKEVTLEKLTAGITSQNRHGETLGTSRNPLRNAP
jgi:hypothetical protein